MFTPRKSLALLAIFGALGFAGCGDDDQEEPTITTTEVSGASGATGASGAGLLPTAIADEGNQICTDGNAELEQAFGQLDNDATPEDFDAFVQDEVIPNIQGQIDDLRELDDSGELQSALDDAEEILGELEENPELFQEGDAFADINDDLTALGLAACAE